MSLFVEHFYREQRPYQSNDAGGVFVPRVSFFSLQMQAQTFILSKWAEVAIRIWTGSTSR